jgi:hypothetical protein
LELINAISDLVQPIERILDDQEKILRMLATTNRLVTHAIVGLLIVMLGLGWALYRQYVLSHQLDAQPTVWLVADEPTPEGDSRARVIIHQGASPTSSVERTIELPVRLPAGSAVASEEDPE